MVQNERNIPVLIHSLSLKTVFFVTQKSNEEAFLTFCQRYLTQRNYFVQCFRHKTLQALVRDSLSGVGPDVHNKHL